MLYPIVGTASFKVSPSMSWYNRLVLPAPFRPNWMHVHLRMSTTIYRIRTDHCYHIYKDAFSKHMRFREYGELTCWLFRKQARETRAHSSDRCGKTSLIFTYWQVNYILVPVQKTWAQTIEALWATYWRSTWRLIQFHYRRLRQRAYSSHMHQLYCIWG